MKCFIAIDGGGSATRCAIADEERIVHQTMGPTAKPLLVGMQQSGRMLFDAVLNLCAVSDIPFNLVRGISVGMSGVWDSSDVKKLSDELYAAANAQMYAMPRMSLCSDVEIAHQGAFGDEPGILVIAGTGSIAVCRDADGRLQRVGGYGPIAGDEGSGSWIGQRALAHVIRCSDGRARPGHLYEYMRQALDFTLPDDVRELALRWHRQEIAPAQFAPLVFKAAVERDREAVEILHQASVALVELADALAHNVGLRNAPVCFRGGVAEQPSMQRRLLRRLDEAIGLQWADRSGTAIDGALQIARSLGVKKNPVVVTA